MITIAKITAGQEFTEFCRHDAGRLYGFLVSAGARPHEVEDALQETLVAMWLRRDKIENLRAYAYTTARNALARVRTSQIEEPVDWIDAQFSMVDPQRAEAHEQVLALIGTLPRLQQQVMALTYDGYAPTEIAELLGSDANTVRVTLHKARRKLQVQIPGRPDGLSGDEPTEPSSPPRSGP
ncbi:RNA polymerase sigma factor [Actinomadura citrea]|uniref:RNA polymerase sigma factor n=1 Tax=Actinomadura citrea TaxID=46158 RepID=UPI002E2C465B|nr:sigma-70 family RNA polymerase sigma factor [Actinomadura citrea]